MRPDMIVRHVWRSGKLLTLATATVLLSSSFLPLLFAVAFASVIDSLSGSGIRATAATIPVPGIVVLVASFVLMSALPTVRELLATTIVSRVDEQFASDALDAALAPSGIGHLETGQSRDAFASVAPLAGTWATPGTAAGGAVGSVLTIAPGAVAAVALTATVWWAPALLVAWILVRRVLRRDALEAVRRVSGRSEKDRKNDYFVDIAVREEFAREVMLFGLGAWLRQRHARGSSAALSSTPKPWLLTRRGPMLLIPLLGVYLALGLEIVRTVGYDPASVAELAFAAQLLLLTMTLGTISDFDLMRASGSAAYRSLEPLLAPGQQTQRPDTILRSDCQHAGDIVFDEVSFRYPRASSNALNRLTLQIPQNRSTALVGLNGAGKTTVLSLLGGFYTPGEGRITIDGIDLREWSVDSWRQSIAVLFQDHVRYPGTVRENALAGAAMLDVEQSRLERAADKAGFSSVVDDLPDGWESTTSILSAGQWQRLAMTRALVAAECGATFLALDEPAANLDAPAEAELYERFLDLTAGLTSVIVSHRFSTVRRADLIHVIEDGRVLESGSHAALVARPGGRYADMFRRQARDDGHARA